MATWTMSTNDALAVKLWQADLFKWNREELEFSKFLGEKNSIIIEKMDLTKTAGDKITFGIAAPLIGGGFGEGETVEGNEADLTTYSDYVTLARRRNAVKTDLKMSQQRAAFSMTDAADQAIKEWTNQYIEKQIVSALTTGNTKIFYGGTASSVATLTTSMKLTPALLSKAKVWGRSEGSTEASKPVMKPVKIKGKEYYVAICHENAMYDMKRDSEYLQNLRECLAASDNHPIFVGAMGVTHDGIIMHSSNKLPFATTGGSGGDVPYATSLLLGQSALVLAWGEMPTYEKETKDYGEYLGVCAGLTMGVKKVQFNSNDYAVVAIKTAVTNITGS